MTITLTLPGNRVATLDETGVWNAPDERLARSLNSGWPASLLPASPSAGVHPCANQARLAAAALGGHLAWPEFTAGDPDTIS